MPYLQLLWSFFQIGLFSIGGGYAAMPLIQHQVVESPPLAHHDPVCRHHGHCRDDPRPIAINSATFVGIQVAGIPGALIATFGCSAPFLRHRDAAGIRILSLQRLVHGARGFVRIAARRHRHDRLRRPLLAHPRPLWQREIAGSIWNINPISLLIFGVGIFLLRHFKASPISIMLGAGAAASFCTISFKREVTPWNTC